MPHKKLLSLAVGSAFSMLLLVACGAPQLPPTPVPPTPAPTSIPPTITSTPVSPMPSLTPLPPAPDHGGSGGGQFAFASNRDGNWEIYVMNADGSEQTKLTDHMANDSWPTLSADGTRIAFISDRDGGWEIYRVNVDGSGLDQLTDTVGMEMYPAWSPDGTQIAYMMGYDIFLMNADGSAQTNLTNDAAGNLYPAWKPDGAQIVFLSLRDGGFQFFEMKADGSDLMMQDRGLPPSERSPGSSGVYIFEDGRIYIGSGGTMETIQDNGTALGEFPVWSPDGALVAFHSNRDGNMEIYVMTADGSQVTRLTDNEADDMFPTWSSDGTKIAFHSNRDGNLEVYVINVDGSNLQNLTNNPAEDSFPAGHP